MDGGGRAEKNNGGASEGSKGVDERQWMNCMRDGRASGHGGMGEGAGGVYIGAGEWRQCGRGEQVAVVNGGAILLIGAILIR